MSSRPRFVHAASRIHLCRWQRASRLTRPCSGRPTQTNSTCAFVLAFHRASHTFTLSVLQRATPLQTTLACLRACSLNASPLLCQALLPRTGYLPAVFPSLQAHFLVRWFCASCIVMPQKRPRVRRSHAGSDRVRAASPSLTGRPSPRLGGPALGVVAWDAAEMARATPSPYACAAHRHLSPRPARLTERLWLYRMHWGLLQANASRRPGGSLRGLWQPLAADGAHVDTRMHVRGAVIASFRNASHLQWPVELFRTCISIRQMMTARNCDFRSMSARTRRPLSYAGLG